MREITYAEALREALREEMRRDERVIILGEEVGLFEGVYKVTQGLLKEFGPKRVIDTPISEIAIIGVAAGAALAGLKPVAEIMYMDFLAIAADQIVTHIAKMRFMSGGQLKVPLVIRTQYSLGRVHGSQHSQFYPSWFLQSPGIKIVLPSNPYDAKGLLKSSIRDENPVLFVESGVLYKTKGEVPENEYTIPLGKADIKKKGEDLTIIAFSRCVLEALNAAKELEERGISAEVIDPRTLIPLDIETIVSSVKKTGRVIIVADDVRSGSITNEIAMQIMENAFDYLDGPIVRVTSPDLPVPFSPILEKQYMVSKDKIIKAVEQNFGFKI
ncbi:MAG: alpha-ketoacid dehydrogenase subunit beta [Thermoproteota archaeon]|jgi:pyruvate/2-oxoglutarate/acetoin dehydrogenase E1 component|nr:alpha-ketoacid dehydrogenase subunit beta [Thermoproteota archaeon]